MKSHGGLMNCRKLLKDAYFFLSRDEGNQIVKYAEETTVNKTGAILMKYGQLAPKKGIKMINGLGRRISLTPI